MADAVRPFPPRRQLGSAFRSGKSKDETADLVGVSSWGSRRSGHLLVSELKPLLYGLDVCGWVFSGGGGIGIQVEVWRKHLARGLLQSWRPRIHEVRETLR